MDNTSCGESRELVITLIRRKLRIVDFGQAEIGLAEPNPVADDNPIPHAQLSQIESALVSKKNELLDELLKRALEQNPDLASQLNILGAQERTVNMMKIEELAAQGRKLMEHWKEERKRERHIRYDDARNINALLGLRRSAIYQSSPRQEKIQMEIDQYYAKYNIEPPKELLKELAKLKRAKELYLKRVKRYPDGRIIRPRLAG
jgi:hypothetical protein